MPNGGHLDFAGFVVFTANETPGDLHQMQPEFV